MYLAVTMGLKPCDETYYYERKDWICPVYDDCSYEKKICDATIDFIRNYDERYKQGAKKRQFRFKLDVMTDSVKENICSKFTKKMVEVRN